MQNIARQPPIFRAKLGLKAPWRAPVESKRGPIDSFCKKLAQNWPIFSQIFRLRLGLGLELDHYFLLRIIRFLYLINKGIYLFFQ